MQQKNLIKYIKIKILKIELNFYQKAKAEVVLFLYFKDNFNKS